MLVEWLEIFAVLKVCDKTLKCLEQLVTQTRKQKRYFLLQTTFISGDLICHRHRSIAMNKA